MLRLALLLMVLCWACMLAVQFTMRLGGFGLPPSSFLYIAVGYVLATIAIEIHSYADCFLHNQLHGSASMLQYHLSRQGWSSVWECSVTADLSVKHLCMCPYAPSDVFQVDVYSLHIIAGVRHFIDVCLLLCRDLSKKQTEGGSGLL